MTGLILESVSTAGREQLAQAQMIYREAFSRDLRVPFTELAEPGEHDRTFLALDGPATVGLAVVRLLGSVRWSFLRYFAITGARRSQGLGREFWHLLPQALAGPGWPGRIVFEVEDPAEAADDAERLIRHRRVAFWTACGARLLPVPGYVLPDYTGSGMTEPMLLMAGGPAMTALPQADQLRALVLAIYTDRYHLPGGHPLVERALASVGWSRH